MSVITESQTQARREDRIESLLSARLFLEPQLAGDRLVFVSSLAGHLSLFSMDVRRVRCRSRCFLRRPRSRTRSSCAAASSSTSTRAAIRSS